MGNGLPLTDQGISTPSLVVRLLSYLASGGPTERLDQSALVRVTGQFRAIRRDARLVEDVRDVPGDSVQAYDQFLRKPGYYSSRPKPGVVIPIAWAEIFAPSGWVEVACRDQELVIRPLDAGQLEVVAGVS